MDHNFDLRLSGTLAAVSAEVIDSPAGQTQAPTVLPITLGLKTPGGLRALSSGAEEPGHAILVGVEPKRALSDLSGVDLQAIGLALWRCAFGGREVEGLWRASIAAVGPEGVLRLRLSIDTPELAALPWDLLYDETLSRFLALDGRSPVTRFLRLPIAPLPWPADRPLRLLFTGASPQDLPKLDVAAEWAGIKAGLATLVQSHKLEASAIPEGATLAALFAALRRGVDVWHFAGHGVDNGLIFADAQHRLALADSGTLGQLLAGEGVRLAVLNACRAGAGGGAAATVAGALVRAGIPAVVAMQAEIGDVAAQAFAEAFYDAIAVGQGVDRALTTARKAIWAVRATEWWAPALYMRTPEGRIWQEPASREATQAVVHGDVITSAGPVATHGSAVNTGSGAAVAGSGITVIAGAGGGAQAASKPYGQQPARPAAWDGTLTTLRDVLATLYPDDDDARRIAAEAQMPTRRVRFSGQAVNTWHSLLQEASLQGMVPAIIDVTCSPNEFQRNKELAEAAAAYLARHTPGDASAASA